MNRRYFKLLWSIPLAFAIFFLALTLLSHWIRFPSIDIIGNKPVVPFRVEDRDHLFYVGSYSQIEPQYDRVVADLSFTVKDSAGTLLEPDILRRFFYTREKDGKKIYCGSVFRLPKNLAIPTEGRIESNIDLFPEMFWVISIGSFVPVVLLLIGAFLLSIYAVYSLIRKSK